MNILEISEQLWTAEKTKIPIAPLSESVSNFSVKSAYDVQIKGYEAHVKRGRKHIGYKVGLTSKAVQSHFGVAEPDFGHLYEDMQISSGEICNLNELIQPKIEGEIAFVFGKKLTGPYVNVWQVASAVEYVTASLEIIDSRIRDWKIKASDTIADNGSSARVVFSNDIKLFQNQSLSSLGMALSQNGDVEITASGSAVLGNPLKAISFLVSALHVYGKSIEPGMVVLSGSLGGMLVMKEGYYQCEIAELGRVSVIGKWSEGK